MHIRTYLPPRVWDRGECMLPFTMPCYHHRIKVSTCCAFRSCSRHLPALYRSPPCIHAQDVKASTLAPPPPSTEYMPPSVTYPGPSSPPLSHILAHQRTIPSLLPLTLMIDMHNMMHRRTHACVSASSRASSRYARPRTYNKRTNEPIYNQPARSTYIPTYIYIHMYREGEREAYIHYTSNQLCACTGHGTHRLLVHLQDPCRGTPAVPRQSCRLQPNCT